MTAYGEKGGKYEEESTVLKEFSEFISSNTNVMLVAHNAKFDMKFIHSRGRRHHVEFPVVPTLDTLKIAKLFFIPALESLRDMKDESAKKTLELLTKKKRISASLGVMAPALEVKIDQWHSAFADVESTVAVLAKMMEFLSAHTDLDIKKYHGKAVKHDF
jgi:DNA polymerase III alpha subunit (gram-positive type)